MSSLKVWFSLLIAITISFMMTQSAGAQTSGSIFADGCNRNTTYLEDWDWPKYTKEGSNGAAGILPDFAHADDSYIIYKMSKSQYDPYYRNVYRVIYSTSPTNKLQIDKNGVSMKVTNGGTMLTYLITSEPDDVSLYKDKWSGNNGLQVNAKSTAVPGTTPYNLDYWPDDQATPYDSANNMSCMVGAHNVTYSPTWTHAQFTKDIGYGSANEACKALEIGCWLGKAFRGVANTLEGVGMAIVESMARFWIPDSAQIKTEFDNFSTFMNNKLGVLVYPIVFFNNMFNAFGNTDNQWCNSNSCTKNFGNLLGQPYILNVDQLKITAPTYWNWFIAMMRGLLVLLLVFGLRAKITKVTDK
jgi:hypothetical protein